MPQKIKRRVFSYLRASVKLWSSFQNFLIGGSRLPVTVRLVFALLSFASTGLAATAPPPIRGGSSTAGDGGVVLDCQGSYELLDLAEIKKHLGLPTVELTLENLQSKLDGLPPGPNVLADWRERMVKITESHAYSEGLPYTDDFDLAQVQAEFPGCRVIQAAILLDLEEKEISTLFSYQAAAKLCSTDIFALIVHEALHRYFNEGIGDRIAATASLRQFVGYLSLPDQARNQLRGIANELIVKRKPIPWEKWRETLRAAERKTDGSP